MKYKAFISYSHADRKWARWLHRRLESYRPPKNLKASDGTDLPRRLSPIFLDRDELSSTANLSKAVSEALTQSEWLIIICSPRAVASRWVNEEVRTFRTRGRTEKILCFLIDGEPGSGDDHECFPEALFASDAQGTAALEPVAADARKEGDGRGNAILKIAAGMLGVGFDALKQRDVRRHQRRLIAIAAGSLMIAAMTIVLAVNAVIARNEAQERRAQSEDLIDFMLGDLRVQLRKIGRLDVFQSVNDKALEYFAVQQDSDDTQHTLAQRARNLRQIGDVRRELGDLVAALEAFEESLRITEQMAVREPDNAEVQIELANSRFYVGFIHWQRGELSEARAIFESNIPIVDAVSAREPDNTDWLVERAYTHTNLGRVQELEGAYEEALIAYRVVMDVNQRLAVLEPENPEWEMELGFAHNNLGKLLFALGRLDESESHFRNDIEIKSRVYAGDPGHNVNRSYFAVSQYYLGQLLVARGAYPEAELILSAALKHFEYLGTVDPERKGWRSRRANIERELGKVYEFTGQTTGSRVFLQSSIGTLTALFQSDQSSKSWRRDLVRSRLTLADFALRHGNTAIAEQELHSARRHIEMLLEQEPAILENLELSVYADICLARFVDPVSANALLENALKKLNQFFADSSDPRIGELKSAAMTGLGEDEAAESLHADLQAIGYVGRGFRTKRAKAATAP